VFVIDMSPSYFWPVKFSIPKENGTGHQVVEFDAEFHRMDTDQITAIGQGGGTNDDMAVKLVRGWRGITDRSGSAVPFSEGACAKLLKIPGAAAAVLNAFWESVTPAPGRDTAAEKN
jgi:hypothetical protein